MQHAPQPAAGWLSRRGFGLALSLLVALHLLLGIDAARQWSATHDEYWHVPAGLAAWREGRFDVDNLNPPLTRLWQTLPAALGGASLPAGLPADDAFRLGDEFLRANREHYQAWLLLARGMNLCLSAGVGLLLAWWGRELFGHSAGLAAAALWLTCPVCLANGALATPDVGATLLFAGTLAAVWRCAQIPNSKTAVVAGLLLGLAQLCKFTNVLLFAFCPVTWGLVRFRNPLPPIGHFRAWGLWGLLLLTSLFIWNIGYLFQGTGRPLGEWQFRSQALQRLQSIARPLSRTPVPLPAAYLAGFDRQRATMEGSHPVYLDGVWNLTGFPDYYLRCAAYKWPHATQLWLGSALIFACCPVARSWRRQNLSLLLPAITVIAVASSIGMQLGFRYILPAFPLLYLCAGQLAQRLSELRWRGGPIAAIALGATLGWGLRSHPNHLAYFNETAGGVVGGRAHLADSNLDWGQDLRKLRDFLKSREVDHVGLAYFGMFPPSALGMDYELPPPESSVNAFGRIPAGWYAVSVNFVLGRPHTIRNPNDSIRGAGYQEFGYFRRLKPVATIGGSIDIYHVEPARRGPPLPGRR